jgi:hypothetical protein
MSSRLLYAVSIAAPSTEGTITSAHLFGERGGLDPHELRVIEAHNSMVSFVVEIFHELSAPGLSDESYHGPGNTP